MVTALALQHLYMGRVIEVRPSCYLVLISADNKTRQLEDHFRVAQLTWTLFALCRGLFLVDLPILFRLNSPALGLLISASETSLNMGKCKTWIHKEWMTAKQNHNQNFSIRNGMYTLRGPNWVTMEINWLIKDFAVNFIAVFLVYTYSVQKAIKIAALQCIWSSSDNVSNYSGQCFVCSTEWASQRQRTLVYVDHRSFLGRAIWPEMNP